MATAKRFEDLQVWQAARKLTNLVYEFSRQGRFAQDHGLKSQIQRAAVSVMSNIAEGHESRTQHLFIDFLGRAKGSAGEVRSQLYIALDQSYISAENFAEAYALCEQLSRQLNRFIHYLKSQPNASRVQEETSTYKT